MSVSLRASSADPARGVEPSVTEAQHAQGERSVEALYRAHHAFVWRNARRLGCSDDWVDDAVHEVFLVAARRLSEFEGHASLQTWLFAILFRVVQRMQRDRARYRARVERYSHTRVEAHTESHEERSEAARYLRDLLARLDEAKRVVVILIELEGMTSAEVAQALGVAQGTVDSRLRAARLQLTKMIERDRTAIPRGTP
jgi:RNA polymerase sigma-70 factor (ECF subfamily)